MFLSNLSNPTLLSDSLCKNLSEVQIQSCILDEMSFSNTCWNEVSLNNSNANQSLYEKLFIENSSFTKSNLFKSRFINCSIVYKSFCYDTLISSKWCECKVNNVTISQSTLQNIKIEKCTMKNSTLIDFEGINSSLKNSVFINCRFEISSGMSINGFSGGKIENCIFVNCNFKGFPLRGVNTDSCIFIKCNVEITDDFECSNTLGLSKYNKIILKTKLNNREQAAKLIEELQ